MASVQRAFPWNAGQTTAHGENVLLFDTLPNPLFIFVGERNYSPDMLISVGVHNSLCSPHKILFV